LLNGGDVQWHADAVWVYSSRLDEDGLLLFPQYEAPSADERIMSLLEYYRQHQPFKDILCWSLYPPQPADLEVRLLAHGFERNWFPHWMWLDFRSLDAAFSVSPDVTVEIRTALPNYPVTDLPYYDPQAVSIGQPHQDTSTCLVRYVVAWLDGRLVGHCALNLTLGSLGVAGIFDVGVVPAVRNHGIGKALTFTACHFAQQMGCHHAVLNATPLGEPIYRQLGFRSAGYGRTWILRVNTLMASPPAPLLIAYAEAVGRGDLYRLATLEAQSHAHILDERLPSGLSLLQIAVHCGQTAVAEWLFQHGSSLDVLSAWDLGWKERARALLMTSPEQADVRLGAMRFTPLHMAVERGDRELVQLLLSAHPDLTLVDAQFQATALRWAQHFQHHDIVALIRSYQSSG
jgi:GNAT superfamily N-acetyltransferase